MASNLAQKTFTKAVAAHPGKPLRLKRSRDHVAPVTFSSQFFPGVKVGPEIPINERKERVLGVRAVPTSEYNSSYGPVLFEQDGFSVVALNTVAEPGWDDLVMHTNDRPVVADGNGRVGILTGTIMVKLDDIHEADKIAGSEGFQVLYLDQAINVAYFRVPENYHLLSGSQKLSQSAGVMRVELEVAQGRKEPQ